MVVIVSQPEAENAGLKQDRRQWQSKDDMPVEILNRPGRLSKAIFEIINSHTKVGYRIIKDVKFPWPMAKMILQHHERLDGSG